MTALFFKQMHHFAPSPFAVVNDWCAGKRCFSTWMLTLMPPPSLDCKIENAAQLDRLTDGVGWRDWQGMRIPWDCCSWNHLGVKVGITMIHGSFNGGKWGSTQQMFRYMFGHQTNPSIIHVITWWVPLYHPCKWDGYSNNFQHVRCIYVSPQKSTGPVLFCRAARWFVNRPGISDPRMFTVGIWSSIPKDGCNSETRSLPVCWFFNDVVSKAKAGTPHRVDTKLVTS